MFPDSSIWSVALDIVETGDSAVPAKLEGRLGGRGRQHQRQLVGDGGQDCSRVAGGDDFANSNCGLHR